LTWIEVVDTLESSCWLSPTPALQTIATRSIIGRLRLVAASRHGDTRHHFLAKFAAGNIYP